MEQYEHGGNIYMYDKKIIDFSSNINPLGMPECAKDAIDITSLSKYPDINYVGLKRAISEYTGCGINNIIVGNGAAELIHLFVRAFSIKRPVIPSPAFSEYERAAVLSGGEPILYKIEEKNGFRIDIERLIDMLNDSDAVILGNPNNPTGQALNTNKIKELIFKAYKLNIPVMIDEAFIEFIKDFHQYESLPFLDDFDNLFIVRAATKFFGMPGIRLGYGLGSKKIIDNLDKHKEPWTVNAFADIIGRAIFNDKEFIERSRQYVNEEIKYMLNELKKNRNLHVYDTMVNFILVKLKKGTVHELKEKLLNRGILIRDASNFRYLDEKYFRVAVKKHEDNLKLIKALEETICL